MVGCLIALLVLVVGNALSWAITTGTVYLICLCFSLEFSLAIATGIWLVLCLLHSIFGKKGGE